MNDKIQNWKNTTWQIQPELDVPELDLEAVQFAVRESNPVEEYKKVLAQSRIRLQNELSEEKDSEQRDLLKTARMIGPWDRLFKSVTGDEVYLLVPRRSGKNQSRTRVILISSNGPEGRRWLTTKVAYREGKPICWCIPVDTVIGKEVHVELRGENSLNLQMIFDEFIGAN